MKRNQILIIVVVVLIVTGWILFQVFNPDRPVQTGDVDFRIWFWKKRALDLVVQVILVFAGALGIAAILPIEDEDD